MTFANRKQSDCNCSRVDLPSSALPGKITVNRWLHAGPVTLTHCMAQPVAGSYLTASQLVVAVHEGEGFELKWRGTDDVHVESTTILDGQVHIGGGQCPIWVRYDASPSFFAVALDNNFVQDIWHHDFQQSGDFAIKPCIAVEDIVVTSLSAAGRRELGEGGPGGRLYLEGLGAMLAVHVLRRYSTGNYVQIPRTGGLAPWQIRRVYEYIEAHWNDELGLVELAKITGLSPHHFGTAFKVSVGKSPHQFVMERRIKHALVLLADEDHSIAEVAHTAGFSSQSHFTANFRRATGLTPGQYRQSLRSPSIKADRNAQ